MFLAIGIICCILIVVTLALMWGIRESKRAIHYYAMATRNYAQAEYSYHMAACIPKHADEYIEGGKYYADAGNIWRQIGNVHERRSRFWLPVGKAEMHERVPDIDR